MRLLPLLSSATLALSLSACAGARQVPYKTGALPPGWSTVHRERAQHVYHHRAGGSILANSSCNVSDADAPLEVLTNHLLLEFKDVREVERRQLVIAGREALRTTIEAKLDGVPVALDLIVLKKDGCSVDLSLVAAPRTLAQRQPDFEAFVNGFALETGSKHKENL